MCRAARCGNSSTNRIRKNVQNFWLCRRMRRTPGRTTMQHGGGTDRTAAPQGPCPLPSTARRTGIGSRDEKRSKVSRSGAFVRLRRPKVQACRPWIHAALPVWNTGCLCGNEYCRLCRSKTIRPTQRYQHSSMTEPSEIKLKDW